METVCHLSVPLIVDIGHGNNWDEAHDRGFSSVPKEMRKIEFSPENSKCVISVLCER